MQVEIGSRSLRDPYSNRDIVSFVGSEFSDREFVDPIMSIPCVNPERTFLEKIVKHRKQFFRVGGVDYAKHLPQFINLVPPDHVNSAWERDYNSMRENMIPSDSPTFKDLMSKIKGLQERINNLNN